VAADDDLDDLFQPIVNDDGEIVGIIDQMTADFLASTDPDPTQESLDAALEGITRVRLMGMHHYDTYVAFDVLRLDESDPDRVAELVAALRIAEADEYGHCMCIGDHRLELWADDRLVETIGLHHWESIRREMWSGDAQLAEPRHLAEWVMRHGINDARDELDDRDRRMRAEERHSADWERAIPLSLRALWPAELNDPDRDLSTALHALEKAVPDPVERVCALYTWLAASVGPWNEFYQYEHVPEVLLLEHPTDALIEAAETTNDAILLGAARLFTDDGFDYRKPGERWRCPESLRMRMLDAVERQGISANLWMYRKAFGLPESPA